MTRPATSCPRPRAQSPGKPRRIVLLGVMALIAPTPVRTEGVHGWTLDERIVGGSVQVMVVLVVARLAGVIRPWSARWRATWSSPAAARMTASLAVQHAADVIIVLDLDGAWC